MGVNLICCLNRTNVLNSDVKVLEDSTANYQISTELALKNIKSLNDLSQAFNFIISGEYYLLLFKITNVYTLIDKIISELNCDDIFTLIEKFVNWINNSESVENKIINEMKLNVEYGTKRLITEIHGFHSQNKIKLPKIYLIKCLTNLSLIDQYIKYINNNEKEKEYKNHSCKSCEGNRFVTRKNIYEYCPEVLIISFDKNYVDDNNKKSFIIDLVDDLNMNEYIENKSPDINFKYTLNSFMRYDLVQHKYVTFLKIKNTWTIMDKDNSSSYDLDFIIGIYNPKILFYVRE